MLQQIRTSLRRNAAKLCILAFLGLMAVHAVDNYPLFFGDVGAPLLRGFGLVFLGLSVGILALCIIDPHVSSGELVDKALKENNTAAGLLFIGRCILLALVLMLVATASRAQGLPANAVAKLPILKQELVSHWPELALRSYLGAQIEQETCISLKNKSC